jgi:hypothetical protein
MACVSPTCVRFELCRCLRLRLVQSWLCKSWKKVTPRALTGRFQMDAPGRPPCVESSALNLGSKVSLVRPLGTPEPRVGQKELIPPRAPGGPHSTKYAIPLSAMGESFERCGNRGRLIGWISRHLYGGVIHRLRMVNAWSNKIHRAPAW